MKFRTKLAATAVALGIAGQASAVTLFKDDASQVDIYGYVKADLRHVSGDIAYRDFWIGNATATTDVSTTNFTVRESRLGFKVTHGDIQGVIEMDFYGGGGNELISNSANPRIRQAFIKTDNWLIGQAWSTFMPLHTLAETLDFGGAHVGEVFIRQGQVRYTSGGFSFAIENTATLGGSGDSDESMPDFIGRYDTKGSWGQASFAVLARKVDQSGIDETGFAFNAAAKFNVGDKNDFKVAVTSGEYGRYAGTTAVPGVATDAEGNTVVEEGLSVTLSYRQWWNDTTRSTVFYGKSTSDVGDNDRSHWGVNLITSHNKKLKYGVEFGSYNVDDTGRSDSSTYLQLSAQFAF